MKQQDILKAGETHSHQAQVVNIIISESPRSRPDSLAPPPPQYVSSEDCGKSLLDKLGYLEAAEVVSPGPGEGSDHLKRPPSGMWSCLWGCSVPHVPCSCEQSPMLARVGLGDIVCESFLLL